MIFLIVFLAAFCLLYRPRKQVPAPPQTIINVLVVQRRDWP